MSLEICFSGNPLDRADHLRTDQNWLEGALAAQSSRFFIFKDLKPLMTTAPKAEPLWQGLDVAQKFLKAGATWVFLGVLNARAHFALAMPASFDFEELNINPLTSGWMDIWMLGTAGSDPNLGIMAQARSLLAWHERRGFCSVCGHRNQVTKGGYARKCSNEHCMAEHFPRTDPVAIMLVVKGEKCLLGRAKHFPPKRYSALAGFMEPGETIEEAVRREVFEETGVRVGRVDYVFSQPWPFPSNIMIGCMAEAVSEEITLDAIEMADAIWVEKSVVKAVLEGADGPFLPPPPIAIARQLLHHWLECHA